MGKGKRKGPIHASSVEMYLEDAKFFTVDLSCCRKLRFERLKIKGLFSKDWSKGGLLRCYGGSNMLGLLEGVALLE